MTVSISPMVTFTVAAGGQPSWVSGLTIGQWGTIPLAASNATLQSIDPAASPTYNPNYPSAAPWYIGQAASAVIDVWNGGAYCSGLGAHGSMVVYGGGHGTQAISSAFRFDLATAEWSMLNKPFPGNGPTYPTLENSDVGANGCFNVIGTWVGTVQPNSPHSYASQFYDPVANRFVQISAADGTRSAGKTAYPVILDLNTPSPTRINGWAVGTASPVVNASESWACYDGGHPSGPRAWVCKVSNLELYNPAGSGSWIANYGSKQIQSSQSWGVAAITRDSGLSSSGLLVIGSYGTIHTLDLGGLPSAVWQSCGLTVPNLQKSSGFEYRPPSEGRLRGTFLTWSAGYSGSNYDANLYEIVPPQTGTYSGTWAYRSLGSGGVTPPSQPNGVYTRFRYVKFASGAEVCINVNAWNTAVYAFRIS